MDVFDNLDIPSVEDYLEQYKQGVITMEKGPSGPLSEVEKAHLTAFLLIIATYHSRGKIEQVDLDELSPHWEAGLMISYYVINNCYVGSVMPLTDGFGWGVSYLNKYEEWSEVIEGDCITEREAMLATEAAYRKLRSESSD